MIPVPLVATSTRLWRYSDGQRPIRILKEDVLERWIVNGFDTTKMSRSDYRTEIVADPALHGIGDGLRIPLGSSDPAPLEAEGFFEHDRSIRVLGTLGPYLFIEQSDHIFAGGAHSALTMSFRIIDLEAVCTVGSWLEPEEHAEVLRKEGSVAREAFRHLREEALLVEPDALEIALVSAAPHFLPNEHRATLMLKFVTGASYVHSDHKWSSYTVAEEVTARHLPSLFAAHATLPVQVANRMRVHQNQLLGWSSVPAGSATAELFAAFHT